MTTALIMGRAKSVWDEVKAAQALTTFDYTLVTGPIGVDYPGEIDCWVWFHTELFEDFARRRSKKGHPPAKSYWGSKFRGRVRPHGIIPVKYSSWGGGGSSGLIAVMVALDELVPAADRVVLAGIPLTIEGGQYDSDKVWHEATKHRHSWDLALPKLMGRVRSFSGWTLKLLGDQPPTADWLREQHLADA